MNGLTKAKSLSVTLWRKQTRLESRIGERFDAIVTGASEKGTWVRLLHPPIEGRLVSGFDGMDVGHRLRVQLVRTDVERGYIDFKKVQAGNL